MKKYINMFINDDVFFKVECKIHYYIYDYINSHKRNCPFKTPHIKGRIQFPIDHPKLILSLYFLSTCLPFQSYLTLPTLSHVTHLQLEVHSFPPYSHCCIPSHLPHPCNLLYFDVWVSADPSYHL